MAVAAPRAAAEEDPVASMVVETVVGGKLARFEKRAGLRDVDRRRRFEIGCRKILKRHVFRVRENGVGIPLDVRKIGRASCRERGSSGRMQRQKVKSAQS